jgi:23S rRNA (guanosine2251-2'-O)-methyltransferase
MKKKKTIQFTNIVYGIHPLIELLQSKALKIGTIYTTKKPIKSWFKIKPLIPGHIQVSFVDRQTLDNVAGCKEHQGILAFTSDFTFAKTMFTPEKQQFILVLDSIHDVRNLGAILRSAYCTGVDGVVIMKNNAASLTAAAIKASAGLALYLKIYVAPSMSHAVSELSKAGYNMYCATLGKGENAAKYQFQGPVALVIGNEETGIAGGIAKQGVRVLLPQKRDDISYNASVAAGILMYSIGCQLNKI